MWITLLFVAQVGSEWVQISQQHYRKPYRPVHKPLLIEDIDLEYEEETTPKSNRVYTNQSLNDYKWSDLPNKKGFVTKLEPDEVHIIRGEENKNFNKEVQRNNVKNSKFEVLDEKDEDFSDAYTFEFKQPGQNAPHKEPIHNKRTRITNTNTQDDRHHTKEVVPKQNPKRHEADMPESQEDVFEESYHMIPNVGSIKRVHLDSRTVRTPILKEISKNEFGSKPIHNVKPPKGNNYNDKEIAPIRPIMVWKNNDQTKKIIPGIIQKVAKDDLVQSPPKNLSRYEETVLNSKSHSNNKDILMTHVVQSNNQISGETAEVNKLPVINFDKPVFVTKEDFDDEDIVTVTSENPESFIEETTEFLRRTSDRNTEVPKLNIKQENKDTPSEDKVNTMENVLKFMRIVTDTISKNTRRSVGSKVRYLENLKDTIMANIEQRIDSIWPDDADNTRRKARSTATARGGGHVEFPSSESALMTISFLTFAVYLIKLVLQVIHTYKNKAMMLTPAVVTAVGRNVALSYRRADYT